MSTTVYTLPSISTVLPIMPGSGSPMLSLMLLPSVAGRVAPIGGRRNRTAAARWGHRPHFHRRDERRWPFARSHRLHTPGVEPGSPLLALGSNTVGQCFSAMSPHSHPLRGRRARPVCNVTPAVPHWFPRAEASLDGVASSSACRHRHAPESNRVSRRWHPSWLGSVGPVSAGRELVSLLAAGRRARPRVLCRYSASS